MVSQGDIVIVDFDPSLGSEQKGKRPGVVVSNDVYHKKTNGFVCHNFLKIVIFGTARFWTWCL